MSSTKLRTHLLTHFDRVTEQATAKYLEVQDQIQAQFGGYLDMLEFGGNNCGLCLCNGKVLVHDPFDKGVCPSLPQGQETSSGAYRAFKTGLKKFPNTPGGFPPNSCCFKCYVISVGEDLLHTEYISATSNTQLKFSGCVNKNLIGPLAFYTYQRCWDNMVTGIGYNMMQRPPLPWDFGRWCLLGHPEHKTNLFAAAYWAYLNHVAVII